MGGKLAGLALIFALAALSPAEAQPKWDCGNENNQASMNACSLEQWKSADAVLNRDYHALLLRMDPKSQKLLRGAQRAWLAYRDAECGFIASPSEGGSVQPTVRYGCLLDATEKREEALKFQLNCDEGDLWCVAPKR
jgi:uncharacterized protein YecT (DUF1311 family)